MISKTLAILALLIVSCGPPTMMSLTNVSDEPRFGEGDHTLILPMLERARVEDGYEALPPISFGPAGVPFRQTTGLEEFMQEMQQNPRKLKFCSYMEGCGEENLRELEQKYPGKFNRPGQYVFWRNNHYNYFTMPASPAEVARFQQALKYGRVCLWSNGDVERLHVDANLNLVPEFKKVYDVNIYHVVRWDGITNDDIREVHKAEAVAWNEAVANGAQTKDEAYENVKRRLKEMKWSGSGEVIPTTPTEKVVRRAR